MTLRDRCKEFYFTLQNRAIMRVGSPVDELMAFVIAETGRAADERLEETLPLCLYFADEAGRDEFVAMVQQVKPNMVSRKLP